MIFRVAQWVVVCVGAVTERAARGKQTTQG